VHIFSPVFSTSWHFAQSSIFTTGIYWSFLLFLPTKAKAVRHQAALRNTVYAAKLSLRRFEIRGSSFRAISESPVLTQAFLPSPFWRVKTSKSSVCIIEDLRKKGENLTHFFGRILRKEGAPKSATYKKAPPAKPFESLGERRRETLLLKGFPAKNPIFTSKIR